MSPLDAAREITEGNYTECFCPLQPEHDAACPVSMLPRIVAVLEAAERLVASENLIEEGEGTLKLYCLACGATESAWIPLHPTKFSHADDCLVALLKSDQN